MKQQLTPTEIRKIQNICFQNPVRACTVAQVILDTCQVVSCSTYARLHKKSKRTVLYQSKHMTGVNVEDRKFIALCS
jgi:hypothetical protein